MNMKRMRNILNATVAATLLSTGISAPIWAQSPRMEMTTEIPESITTPDRVETRIGTLEFFDGIPTKETSQLVYDHLDFHGPRRPS
jgi:hypothetical protein